MPQQIIVRLAHSNILPEIKLELNSLKKALLIMRSINHKLRQDIINLFEDNKRLTVTEIYIKIREDGRMF